MNIHPGSCLPSNGAANNVNNSENCRSFGFRFMKGSQRIGGFAALAYDEHDVIRPNDRVAIPKLGGVINFNRDSSNLLEHELSNKRSMPRRPTSRDDNSLGLENSIENRLESAKLRSSFFHKQSAAQ